MSEPRKTPKRGRPEKSAAQREHMQRRISEAAMGLFQQEGYAKISMRRIAKEIGCTPMTLYGYYDGKIDILKTLWGGVFDELFMVLKMINTDTDPELYLQNLCVAYVDFWMERPDSYRLVFMAEGVTQPDVSAFLDSPDSLARFELLLSAVQRLDGQAMQFDLKAKTDFLISVLHGIAHNAITISGYEWASPEVQIRYAIKGIL